MRSVRLPPCLAALLAQVHPTNASAALRALLLLGAHAAGYDLTACAAEVYRVLGTDISDQTRQALTQAIDVGQLSYNRSTDVGQLSYSRSTDVGQLSYSRSTDVGQPSSTDLPVTADGDAPAADPLDGIGFEV